VTLQCYRGRSRTSRRPRVSGDAGYIRSIAASCKRKPFGGCNLDQIATTAMVSMHVPSAAAFQTQACCCLRDACIPYASHKEHAACRRASRREQAGRGRPVLKATCEHPDARLPSAICQMWRERPGHTAGPYRYATNDSLRLDGRDLLAPCCLAPTMSGDLSRSNARGRSDLHSPNDAWTSQTHGSPGMLQDRRGMNAASSPFRQNGVARLAATDRSGFRRQIDGIG